MKITSVVNNTHIYTLITVVKLEKLRINFIAKMQEKFILMSRELVRETIFQSSPNFLFLMKRALITSVCLHRTRCQMYSTREQGLQLSDFCILGTQHPAGHIVLVVLMIVNGNSFHFL